MREIFKSVENKLMVGLFLILPNKKGGKNEMLAYLENSVPQVKKIIDTHGIHALYEPFTNHGMTAPRYVTELLLENWELDEILGELGINPVNPFNSI